MFSVLFCYLILLRLGELILADLYFAVARMEILVTRLECAVADLARAAGGGADHAFLGDPFTGPAVEYKNYCFAPNKAGDSWTIPLHPAP